MDMREFFYGIMEMEIWFGSDCWKRWKIETREKANWEWRLDYCAENI